LSEKIEEKIKSTKGELSEIDFNSNDSICRQVSNREPQLQRFSQENDVILFVSGKKSSNGMALYQVCLSENPRSYFIESEEEIDLSWLQQAERVGICGATSTPMWLMEQVKSYVDGIEERLLQD
jgi:4-hydroxy-3-methylbut-2-enyl diphosphate reductase